MFGNIIGFILLIFLVLFVIGSCIVSSHSDEDLEKLMRKDVNDEKKNL